MQYDLGHVRMMMMEKIAGTLEAPEDMLLQQLIRDNEEVAGLWQEVQARLAEPAAAAIMKDLSGRQEKVWAEVEKRVDGQEPAPSEELAEHPVRPIRFGRMAAAACLIVVVAGALFYFLPHPKGTIVASAGSSLKKSIQLKLAGGRTIDLTAAGNTIQLQEAQLNNTDKTLSFQPIAGKGDGLNTLTVPVGKDYKIVLEDGTEVWMNSATVLQFPFAFRSGSREISLSGEAYLKVAPNPSKPFIVHLPHASVQVLGTAFNVNTYDSGIVMVSLVSGAVKLRSDNKYPASRPGPDKELTLRPGMEGVCSENASADAGLSLHSFDEKDVLSWMHGIHVFYNASVQEISKVLPRWYGIAVILDNSHIARERYSGFIDRNKPIQDFLENLKSTNSADYYFSGDTLHLR
ncbi:MAG TPA: FecR family protein [Puia sp.]|nr:FecR family protein [Puia sp.]